jgi:hypothetical protein
VTSAHRGVALRIRLTARFSLARLEADGLYPFAGETQGGR